ncbi:MAG TPA: universal stress protein [Firmicutes bacterium]|nr:universal stress protein [Bacillota bacterium]
MKILACTDGSEHSRKALDKAAEIASGCLADEVAVIHVYEEVIDVSTFPLFEPGAVTRDPVTREDVEKMQKLREEQEAQRDKILADALEVFNERGLKAKAIIKQGHPAETIVETAAEGGYDMIVLGSRGFGGLKKLLLGSVSNAVLQEAKNCSVLTVK